VLFKNMWLPRLKRRRFSQLVFFSAIEIDLFVNTLGDQVKGLHYLRVWRSPSIGFYLWGTTETVTVRLPALS
jgi:hypothetical protein